MSIRNHALWATLGALALPTAAHADESLWIYTKGAETLPKGETEVKAALISRRGKAQSDYVFNEVKLEVEHGFNDRLTGYAELVIYDHNYSTTNPDLQPLFDTQGGAGGQFKKTQIAGIDLGVKYNILSPYKDPIGFAVSVEWDHRFKYRIDGSKINQDEVDLTLHFQKNFFNDQLILAFSPKIEWEYRLSPGIIEKEIALDISAGASYRVAPNLYIGGEFRHQSDYLSPYDTVTNQFDPNLRPSKFLFKFGSQYQNGNYLGPTVHYASKKWWATAGALWQISGGGKFAINQGGRNVDEHEKVHVGLTFGLEL